MTDPASRVYIYTDLSSSYTAVYSYIASGMLQETNAL